MKAFLTVILGLSILIGIFSACNYHDDIWAPPDVQNASGLVLDFGDPAVDGCGYLIKVDTGLFAPIQLDSIFKVDSLRVVLDFNVLSSTWNCGWRPSGFQQIAVLKIRKSVR